MKTEGGVMLRTDHIDSKPIDTDWGEADWTEGGYYADDVPRTQARIIYPTWDDVDDAVRWLEERGATHETIGRVRDAYEDDNGDDGVREAIIDSGLEDHFSPVMNYRYPIAIGPHEGDAQAILDSVGCLVLVEYDGDYCLALTGGGMDLSDKICKAYIALGFYPPAHFAELPRMGKEDLALLQVCAESLRIARDWRQRAHERLLERIADVLSSS
jgi:hypothetical protein